MSSLEQDRAALEEARRLFEALERRSADADELAEGWLASLPIGGMDQYLAAEEETRQSIRAAGAAIGREPTEQGRGFGEWSALLFAGMTRCFVAGHACQHASGTIAGQAPRPLWALLAARVITCRPCALCFAPIVAAADARARDHSDDVCDFCLEPEEWFHSAVCQYGPVTLYGDACPACLELAAAPRPQEPI